jgi:hypothetical protein
LKSSDDKYFTGKKRYTHVVMQGRFKHDVSASDLWTGHEWFQVSDLVPTRCVAETTFNTKKINNKDKLSKIYEKAPFCNL